MAKTRRQTERGKEYTRRLVRALISRGETMLSRQLGEAMMKKLCSNDSRTVDRE